jgi:3'-phosphoadenosine 5'-phosphosulfate sulfotransferase (PAPS reductase)/FAD synthetase
MLKKVLEAGGGQLPDQAIVCFANTGKEDAATLQFVHDCETNWNVKINWLEFLPDNPKYKIVDFSTASRNGEPFEQLINKKKYLPNTFARFCTTELKIIPIERFMASLGYEDFVTFVGIRADEPRRVAKMKNNKSIKETPLATDKVTTKDVLDFWDNQSFNLQTVTVNGNSLLSNCDLCFLKKANHLVSLIRDNPNRAIWWAEQEKIIGARFNQAHPSYADMLTFNEKQNGFLFENEETIACFCGE